MSKNSYDKLIAKLNDDEKSYLSFFSYNSKSELETIVRIIIRCRS